MKKSLHIYEKHPISFPTVRTYIMSEGVTSEKELKKFLEHYLVEAQKIVKYYKKILKELEKK